MPRPGANPLLWVERFFQLALLSLVTCGYLAVAGSGYLDKPTIILTACGLLLRALLVTGVLRFEISDRWVTILTLAYIAFYPLDYFFLAGGFLNATVHLVFFLAVMKILTARTNRDYLYTASIALLEILAAAILSANLNFLLFLAFYLLSAIAAFTSAEIRRAMQKPHRIARGGQRRFTAAWRRSRRASRPAFWFSPPACSFCCPAPPTRRFPAWSHTATISLDFRMK